MTTSGIDGLYNFRDTGGLPLRAGGSTPPGVLYRSDALATLTENGLDELAATEIGVIVDFRTLEERHAAPDRVPPARSFRTIELPVLQGAMKDMTRQLLPDGGPSAQATDAPASASIPTLSELYVGMLASSAASFVQVARLIADPVGEAPAGVLVHCTAGKDRTGVATALILDAVGVERSAIVADYASSQINLAGPWSEGMLHMITSVGVAVTPELRTLVTGTPPDAIESALAWVDDNHGDAAGYLRSGGLSEDELSALRSRLTAQG